MKADDIVAVEQATLDHINGAVPLPDSAAADRGLKHGQRILSETLPRRWGWAARRTGWRMSRR